MLENWNSMAHTEFRTSSLCECSWKSLVHDTFMKSNWLCWINFQEAFLWSPQSITRCVERSDGCGHNIKNWRKGVRILPEGIRNSCGIVHFLFQIRNLLIVIFQRLTYCFLEIIDLDKIWEEGEDILNFYEAICLPHQIIHHTDTLTLKTN